MHTRHVVRVELSGASPSGKREQFATIVVVSSSDRTAGKHLQQAEFRARVRGLSAPWEVLAEYDIA
jgi:hypothetical protein